MKLATLSAVFTETSAGRKASWACSMQWNVTQSRPNIGSFPQLCPRGLSRDQSAAYVGVGVTKFNEMVEDGRMPPPKHVDGR